MYFVDTLRMCMRVDGEFSPVRMPPNAYMCVGVCICVKVAFSRAHVYFDFAGLQHFTG